jgi:membrane protein YqaA with SNARE-associated domain
VIVREWGLFVLLGLVTNTAVGPPFDPVLLAFAGGRPWAHAWPFVLVGSLCAGAGGALEAVLGRKVRRRTAPPAGRLWRGRAFYFLTMATAASPLPFTVTRLAALARRPDPMLYGACIVAGRLPRYALTVLAWQRLVVLL